MRKLFPGKFLFHKNLRFQSTNASYNKIEIQHAVVSTFDLFSIGIGPSSSHTVGPMRAATIFVCDLEELGVISDVSQLRIDLYGSLAMTGSGHGTPNAILMGLEGETPESVPTETILQRVEEIMSNEKLNLKGQFPITFKPKNHLIFNYGVSLLQHPNGMRFSAFDSNGDLIATNEFFSIGGGFVVNADTKLAANVYFKDSRVDHSKDIEPLGPGLLPENVHLENLSPDQSICSKEESSLITAALPFYNSDSLFQLCEKENLRVSQVVYKNELHWRSPDEIKTRTLNLWKVMNQSIDNGIKSTQEFLPGKLKVRRRAPTLYKKLMGNFAEFVGVSQRMEGKQNMINFNNEKPVLSKYAKRSIPALDWISLYALAVNEENAAGGRVVTAPTNGAAGVLPAVLKYYLDFICPSPAHAEQDIVEFLLTAAAIGMLYKRGASISAAEMGCQGEVGVACSMAAGAFTAVMGGSLVQIENAAEIGMEHNLGLTCDPPLGLVVIPCIERNALAAVKSITAAQLALNSDIRGRVSLDQVIATMRQTGIDMQTKYKETSEGGLAVNVPVC